jgi:hypothetical protein
MMKASFALKRRFAETSHRHFLNLLINLLNSNVFILCFKEAAKDHDISAFWVTN